MMGPGGPIVQGVSRDKCAWQERMRIRKATSADRDAIVHLDRVDEADPERTERVDRFLRSATCIVAEHRGEVIAYGVLDYTFYGHGFIRVVYVAERERRRGIGRALLQELALRCETRKLFTSTSQSNDPMQHLLKTLGYIPSGIIHNLDPGDPEIVYFLDCGELRTGKVMS